MAVFVVEHRFESPIDPRGLDEKTQKVSPCLPVHDVKWITSLVASDGTRMYCVYDAADGETLRRAYRLAQVPFAEVWPAKHLHP